MKCMSRNKARFFYALYEGKTPITDDYGNVTGEYDIHHGKRNTDPAVWGKRVL